MRVGHGGRGFGFLGFFGPDSIPIDGLGLQDLLDFFELQELHLEVDLQVLFIQRFGELGHDPELLLEVFPEIVHFQLGRLVERFQLLGQVVHQAQLFQSQAGHLLDLGLITDGLFKMILDLPLERGALGLELTDHRPVVLKDGPSPLKLSLDGFDLLAGLFFLRLDLCFEVLLDLLLALHPEVLHLGLDLFDDAYGFFQVDVFISHHVSPLSQHSFLCPEVFLSDSGVNPRFCNLFFFFIL